MSHEHCTCCLRERLTRWSQLQVKRSCHVTSVAVANLGQKHVHLCQTQTRIFVYFLVHNVQIKHHDICSSQPVSIMSKWLVYVPYIIFRNNKVDDSLTGCVCVYTYFILYILVHTLQSRGMWGGFFWHQNTVGFIRWKWKQQEISRTIPAGNCSRRTSVRDRKNELLGCNGKSHYTRTNHDRKAWK